MTEQKREPRDRNKKADLATTTSPSPAVVYYQDGMGAVPVGMIGKEVKKRSFPPLEAGDEVLDIVQEVTEEKLASPMNSISAESLEGSENSKK